MFNSTLGTPVITQISDTELRITGVTLDPDATGVIGFSTANYEPDIRLPDTFRAPNAEFGGAPVALDALVKVDVAPATVGPFTNLPPSVEKTGQTSEDFAIRITNTKVDEVTQGLEIYLILLGQATDGAGCSVSLVDSPNASVTIGH